jgi:hypothetical protein
MEKQERVVDPAVIDEVMKLPFHKAYQHLLNGSGGMTNNNGSMVSSSSSHNNNSHQQSSSASSNSNSSSIITRELVESAASLEDSREDGAPKILRDLRVAYELILDHKHTRLRVMEVARAIREAASATPPAFSPGGSRGTTPGGGGGGYGSSGSSFGMPGSGGGNSGGIGGYNTSNSPSMLGGSNTRMSGMAEQAARALLHPPGSGVRGMAGSSEGMMGGGGGSTHIPPPSSIPSLGPPGGGSPHIVQMQSSIPGNIGMIAQHQHGRRNRRWYLGIQSKKDPAHVMTEVYKALAALGCEWLQLSSYRIKCRWRPNVPRESLRRQIVMPGGGDSPEGAWGDAADMNIDIDDGSGGMKQQHTTENLTRCIGTNDDISVPDLSTNEYCIKIGLTLYKVQQSIYLLDFQKMTGDAFSFMTLCANIITELKTLSAASKQQLAQQQALLAQQQQQQQTAASHMFQPIDR